MPRKEKPDDPRYVIHCGDAEFRFSFGKLYRWSYLKQVFEERLKPFADNFLPGLVLKDGAGQLWKPEVMVEMVPVTEEPLSEESCAKPKKRRSSSKRGRS